MELKEIRQPIAVRSLKAGAEPVVVTIGKPEPFEDGGDFYCPYSIEFLGKKKVSYAGGMDAVQALQLTMKKIGVDLAHLKTPADSPVTWLDELGETGFPQ